MGSVLDTLKIFDNMCPWLLPNEETENLIGEQVTITMVYLTVSVVSFRLSFRTCLSELQ